MLQHGAKLILHGLDGLVGLGVFADNLGRRLEAVLSVKAERRRAESDLQAQDRQERVQRRHVLLDAQLNRNVMDARRPVVICHAHIGLVIRVEVPHLPPCLRVDHRTKEPRRDDNLFLPQPELGHEAVIANVNGVQRLQRVGVDADTQRRIIVDVVGNRRPEVAEQALLHRHHRLRLQPRIELGQLRRRAAYAEDVLTVRVRPALHVGLVQLVRDRVGFAVPAVPLKPGIIPTLARPSGDEHALGDLRVVPGQGDKLVGHAIAQTNSPGLRQLIALAIAPHVVPDFDRSAAQSHTLLDQLLQLLPEGVFPQHVVDEALQRVRVDDHPVLVDLLLPARRADRELALLAPHQARQLRADGLGGVQPKQLPGLVRLRAHRHHGHNVPGLIQSPVEVFPDEHAVVVKLTERRHAAQLEYVLELAGDARRRRRPLQELRPPCLDTVPNPHELSASRVFVHLLAVHDLPHVPDLDPAVTDDPRADAQRPPAE